MSPKVTILLTTYNRPRLLEKAMKSVLEQTFTDWECIVLDDNSDNAEQLRLLAPGEKFNDARFIVYRSDVKPEDRKKTVRYATMINLGLDMAKGEYITYLCDDDFYMPNRLQEMVDFLDQNPDKSVVYGRQQVIDEVGASVTLRNQDRILDNASCVVDHSSVMHRKSCLETAGKWDDNPDWWGEGDAHFWERLNKAGYLFYPIHKVLDAHLVHKGSWTREARWQKLGTADEPKYE